MIASYLNLLSEFLSENGLKEDAYKVASLAKDYSEKKPTGTLKTALGPPPSGLGPPPSVSDETSTEKETSTSHRRLPTITFSSVERNSADKESVTRLQESLVRAGFPLPRFGVDGKFGEETEASLIRFKRKAKEDGKYTGPIDGIATEEVFSLLESYSASEANPVNNMSEPRPQQSEEVSGILYLGDSQMVGSLGRAFIANLGRGVRLAKSGTRASYWANNSKLIEALKTNPSKVIVSLNGNGINGTENLIATLKKYLPENTPLVWSGAPPPLYRPNVKTWAGYLTTASGFDKSYNERNANNETVASMVNSVKNWKFINPYDHIKYQEPITVGGKQYASGYICERCDGVHLPRSASEKYVSKISGLL